MLPITVSNNRLHIGKHFSVSFQRTLRIPDDGKTYPLPPGLGQFPVLRVADYAHGVPESWREHGGVFIPMYQREALWMQFGGDSWHPNAVKIGIGKTNALSATAWSERLLKQEHDYMVVPEQPWLDGINAGNGFIRQFVAMPLGMGYTVEAQMTGREEFGGIQIISFEPRPGRFPDNPPPQRFRAEMEFCCSLAMPAPMAGAEMGLGAGGKMKQTIYEDEYGIDTWDENNHGRVFVHIVNSMAYRDITGMEPPATPVSAREYANAGLPWFDLYDEGKKGIDSAKGFAGIKTVKELDTQKGFSPQQDDGPVVVSEKQVVKLGTDKTAVGDGKW